MIEDIYEKACISVKSMFREIEGFRVSVHQESALNPYLFSVVIDEVTKLIQEKVPWVYVICERYSVGRRK